MEKLRQIWYTFFYIPRVLKRFARRNNCTLTGYTIEWVPKEKLGDCIPEVIIERSRD